MKTRIFITVFAFVFIHHAFGQNHSIARQWNEALLQAIENDFARPPVHARNLFHVSLAMYDAWAIYDDTASTFLLNNTFRNFTSTFNGVQTPSNIQSSREEAISMPLIA